MEAWGSIVEDPEKARAVQVAARQGRLRARALGRGRRADLGGARVHRQDATAPTGSPASRRSRRCRWSPTRRHAFPLADRRRLPELLRLVRRPAAGFAADLGRPDRRARVGGLVERELPDRLGHEHPADRTPDAHFMVEARYRGQKVVVVSPDYAGHTKFADHWLPAGAGTDGALAMAMAHVIFQGVLRRAHACPYFDEYAPPLHRPPLPRHPARARRRPTSPTASCAPPISATTSENADWKTVVARRARRASPSSRTARSASAGATRAGEAGTSRSTGVDPALTLLGRHDERVEPSTCRALDVGRAGGEVLRGVPAKRIGGQLVTTVFDLMARPVRRRAARGCPDVAVAATTTPTSRTRRPGRSRSRASTRDA